MLEVLGLAASVAGLLGLTMHNSEIALKYFPCVKHAEEQTQDLPHQLTALENALRAPGSPSEFHYKTRSYTSIRELVLIRNFTPLYGE